jgi:hypothetical protein
VVERVHGIGLHLMMNGAWRCYGYTLCGLPGSQVGLAGSTADDDAVTCKRCRNARSFADFAAHSREHKAKGRIA